MRYICFLGVYGWVLLILVLAAIAFTVTNKIMEKRGSIAYRNDFVSTMGLGVVVAIAFIFLFSQCGKMICEYCDSTFESWEELGYTVYVDGEEMDSAGEYEYVIVPGAEWNVDKETKELLITNP